jgi:hypothetical protein
MASPRGEAKPRGLHFYGSSPQLEASTPGYVPVGLFPPKAFASFSLPHFGALPPLGLAYTGTEPLDFYNLRLDHQALGLQARL